MFGRILSFCKTIGIIIMWCFIIASNTALALLFNSLLWLRLPNETQRFSSILQEWCIELAQFIGREEFVTLAKTKSVGEWVISTVILALFPLILAVFRNLSNPTRFT